MSDQAAAAPDAGAGDAALTAGAILRNAREQAGVHIGALAVSLKVPLSKLEALEADRLDLLPDTAFARALACSICRTLKLDAGPVLRMLPQPAPPRLRLDARLSNASYDPPGMKWRAPLLSTLPRPVVLFVGLLLVAALALLFVPSMSLEQALAPASVAAPAGDAAGTFAVTALPAAPSVAKNAMTPSLVSPAVALVAAPVSVAPAPVARLTVSAGVVASPAAADQNAQAPQPVSSLVVFKTRGSSWVEVTDASGVVQLRKIMSSGETASASGTLPLSVIVGRVDSTDVLVRTVPFDLAPLARDNVARFQIK